MNSESAPPIETPAAPPARPLGGWLDLILFFFSAFALYLLVQFAALSLLLFEAHQRQPHLTRHQLFQQVTERVQYNAFFLVPVQLTYYALILLVLFGLVRLRRRLPFWSSLALRPLPWTHILPVLASGGLLAFLVQLSSVYIPPPEPLPFDRLFSSRAAAWLIIAAAVLVAPFIEELIFRGYIYTLLERLWGTTPAVLASGLLFGAIHFPQLYPGYFQMLLLCVVGLVFSLARARTGTLVASVLLHFGYNATIAVIFLISPQFRQLAAVF